MLLSEAGHQRAEEILARIGLLPEGASLYEPAYINLVHQLYAALRAHNLYHRDQHYVVQDGEVIIVDEFTGRLMTGRRWSDGLHQAVETKEGIAIRAEDYSDFGDTTSGKLSARYAFIDRVDTLRYLGIGPHLLRVGGGVRMRLN